MNYFLFTSFLHQEYFSETLYAIESLKRTLKSEDNVKIVLYTDNPSFYTPYYRNYNRVIIEELPLNILNELKQYSNCSLLWKITIIQLFTRKYSGKVIYSDSDMLFIKSIVHMFNEINNNSFVIYQRLSDMDIITSLNDNISSNKTFENFSYNFLLLTDETSFSPETEIFDSGFIGFETSQIGMLDKIKDILIANYSLLEIPHLAETILSIVVSQTITNTKEIFSQHVTFHYTTEKHTRLLVGYLMDILSLEDYISLEEIKQKYKLGPLSTYGICTENLQAFITFMKSLKSSNAIFSKTPNSTSPDIQERTYFQLMFKKFYKAYYINQTLLK